MVDFLKYLQIVLQFGPAVLALIKAVEAAFPAAAGETKKALVVSMLNPPADDVTVVNGLIDSTVNVLNSRGVFQSAPKKVA